MPYYTLHERILGFFHPNLRRNFNVLQSEKLDAGRTTPALFFNQNIEISGNLGEKIPKTHSRKVYKISIISLLLCFCTYSAYGKDTNDNQQKAVKATEPPKIGNFALPPSQQPGPLISFGENIISKNQTQLQLIADEFKGEKKHAIDIIPFILYGITDNCSILFAMPIAASYREDQSHSDGLEDAALQFEYAFYTQQTAHFSDQATIVTNVTFPTGSSKKQPSTGFGSPTLFFGATFNRTYIDWFGFTSHGIVQTTSHDGTKFGDQFLYQFGLGKNILTIGSKWIFAGMVEADGQYMQKNRINGVTDPNSGGNVLYITPSLWLSSKKLIIQLGIGFPAIQNLFGEQRENHYLLAGSLTWTF